MFDVALVRPRFEAGQDFDAFVRAQEAEGHDGPWKQRFQQLALDGEQARLVGSFTRRMNVLCMTGPWCGDCALQGAALARIAEGSTDRIVLRFIDRTEHPELQVKVPINGGMRVPVTFFMSEDFEPVDVFGDRTLSRYRAMTRKSLGDDAPVLPPAPEDPVRAVLQEMLDRVERVHLLLRLSTRLRALHGD